MSSSSDVTAKCSHCGFRLSPTYVGPCPKCGKVGKLVSVSLADSVAISDRISAVVNTSSGSAFTAHNVPAPEWLPDASKSIAGDVIRAFETMLPDILAEHDKDKEAKEKRLTRRAQRFAKWLLLIIVSAIIGAILRPAVTQFIFGG